MKDEIKGKEINLESDLESRGEKRFFLIALDVDKIIGTIEFGPASALICECTDNKFKGLVEVGTVFVLPDYQMKGVGNLLLNTMFSILHNKGIEEICLDSGYSNAQKVWKKKFGKPDYWLKDYWGEGYDHMIWKISVNDLV